MSPGWWQVVAWGLAVALMACGSSREQQSTEIAAPTVSEVDAADSSGTGVSDETKFEGMKTAIARTMAGRHRCWERAAADGLRVFGEVVAEVRFASPGRVASVKLVKDKPRDPVLTECVRTLYRDYGWPAYFDKGDVVRVPMTFAAATAQYTVRRSDVVADAGEWNLLTAKNTGNRVIELAYYQWQRATPRSLTAAPGQPLLLYVRSGALSYRMPKTGAKRRADTGTFLLVQGGETLASLQSGSAGAAFVVLRTRAGVAKTPAKAVPPPVVPRTRGKDVAVYKLAGGNGTAEVAIEPATSGTTVAYAGYLTLQSGVAVPPHQHAHATEVLYVTKGTGEMRIAGDRYDVEPDMAIQIPPGVRHAFVATSDVEAVQFYTPSGPEERFK